MKRFNATAFFAVVVAVLAAFTAYDYWSSQKRESAKEAQAKVVRLSKDEIASIEIAHAQADSRKNLKLVKLGGQWRLESPLQESADQQQVFTYLDQLTGESVSQVVKESDASGSLQLSDYGLTEPLFTLTLLKHAPEGREIVKVGTVRAYDGSLYGQIDDEKKIVLLSSSWDVLMTKPVGDFRDTKLYHGPMKAIFDKISVIGGEKSGGKSSEKSEQKSDGANFELTSVDGVYTLKNSIDPIYQPSVQAWLEQIKALRGAAFEDAPRPGFKSQYTINLLRHDQPPITIEIARDRDHPEQFEATSTDLPGALSSRVILGKTAADSVVISRDALYSKKAPFEFALKEAARLKFHDARTKSDLDTQLDPTKPDSLVTKLTQLEAVRFLGAKPKSGIEKKFPSRLSLLKSNGDVVFEMVWGEPVTEPATLYKPEATYLPVMTNLSNQIVGVPEKLISNLGEKPPPDLTRSQTKKDVR